MQAAAAAREAIKNLPRRQALKASPSACQNIHLLIELPTFARQKHMRAHWAGPAGPGVRWANPRAGAASNGLAAVLSLVQCTAGSAECHCCWRVSLQCDFFSFFFFFARTSALDDVLGMTELI